MNLSAIRHRQVWEYVYPSERNRLQVRLEAARGDLGEAYLLYWIRGDKNPNVVRRASMTVELRDSQLDHFGASIRTDGIAAYVRYRFLLGKGDEKVWYGPKGFASSDPGMDENFFEFLWPNEGDRFQAPSWGGAQVYYQIFPERFERGGSSKPSEMISTWGTTPTASNFMGGDIRGIIRRLDHIEDLGATCLYLTPVFTALSNHKYDTADYRSIDPNFGTFEDLKELVTKAHRRNIRVLLDGVFNHSGCYWPPFQDLLANGRASKYKDWFFPHSFPVSIDKANYDCVGHYKWMPKINLSNPEARHYFIEIGKYWTREAGTDGWRLDVADEVSASFWEQFSYELKNENPQILLLGETWGDPSRLLAPGRLDSAMNYGFRDAARDWLALGKASPTQFDHLANSLLALCPYEPMLRMYNLLDSHDTPRFLTLCGEDIRKYRLAVALQMTFPGCPAVYYGDEIGMTGGNDPLCRGAMDWSGAAKNSELLEWFRGLIALRRTSKSLMSGNYHTSLCDDKLGVYGFCRSFEDETTLVVFNNGDEADVEAKVPEGCLEWREALADGGALSATAGPTSGDPYEKGYGGRLGIRMPSRSVRIFKTCQGKEQ